jgi:hypothetical protein
MFLRGLYAKGKIISYLVDILNLISIEAIYEIYLHFLDGYYSPFYKALLPKILAMRLFAIIFQI